MKLPLLFAGGASRAERPGPIRTSAMYRVQEALGARFKDDAGWRVADVYTSVDDEIARARSGIGLYDASAGGKLIVRGDAVEGWGSKLLGNALPGVGRAAWEKMNGASVLVCRRNTDELLVLTPPREAEAVATALASAADGAGCVHVMSESPAYSMVNLISDMGGQLGRLLERVVAVDLSAVPPLGLAQCDVARVHATLVRLDHPQLRAVSVLVGREHGDFLWRTLTDAGRDLGLTPIGAAAYTRMMGA